MVRQYQELARRVEAEQAKPAADQNYAPISGQLQELADNPQSGKAGKYAVYLLEKIKRIELVVQTKHQLAQSQTRWQQMKEKIEQERIERRKEVRSRGDFIVVGQIRPSLVYADLPGPKRYQIVRVEDGKEKTICYAQPVAAAAAKDLAWFMQKKVGLVGQVVPDPESKLGLVKFSEIMSMDEE